MSYIKIDENSRILLEDSNYTLEYRKKSGIKPDGSKPTSEYKWVLGGYYATLDHLLQSWVTNAPARENPAKIQSLQDIVRVIQEAEEHIKTLIHKK